MFNLTEKEMIILAKFIDMHKDLRQKKIDVFSAEIKKRIAEELEIEDFNTLNIYIKRLKDKNAIRSHKGSYQISPILIKEPEEEGVKILWRTSLK